MVCVGRSVGAVAGGGCGGCVLVVCLVDGLQFL